MNSAYEVLTTSILHSYMRYIYISIYKSPKIAFFVHFFVTEKISLQKNELSVPSFLGALKCFYSFIFFSPITSSSTLLAAVNVLR